MALQRTEARRVSHHALEQNMALGPQAQGKTADGEGDSQATPILACLRNDSASNPRTNLGGGRNRGFRLRKKIIH